MGAATASCRELFFTLPAFCCFVNRALALRASAVSLRICYGRLTYSPKASTLRFASQTALGARNEQTALPVLFAPFGATARSPLASATWFAHLLGPGARLRQALTVCAFVIADLSRLLARCDLLRKPRWGRVMRKLHGRCCLRPSGATGRSLPVSATWFAHLLGPSDAPSQVQFCAHSPASAVCFANRNVPACGGHDKPGNSTQNCYAPALRARAMRFAAQTAQGL